MRAKNIRTTTPEEPPPPPTSGGAVRWVLIAVVLLVLGASFGIVMVKLTAGPSASPSPSPSSAIASTSPAPSASGSPGASSSPSPSPSQAAPELAAMMPTSVNGTAMTVDSAKDATKLGSGPAPRAIGAAAKEFGKTAADFEIAAAYDAAGSTTLQILGFRLPGVPPLKLQPVIMNAWLAADVPGVTKTTVVIGGRTATKVSYGDGGSDEYVVVYSDALFDIETSDATLAAKAAAAIGGGSASGSPIPSSSPAASGSTSPSPTPAPSGSPSASPS